MKKQFISLILGITFCGIVQFSYAENKSIRFYVSNNSQEISIEEAFSRMTGLAQQTLRDETIEILQKEHVEQGKMTDILGAYEMASDSNVTGDNTEMFSASPYQAFTQAQVIAIAINLANHFHQESVAVFVPSDQGAIAEVNVKFNQNLPTINQTIKTLQEKLPNQTQAFSLQLMNTEQGYIKARVLSIEWLGSGLHVDEIQNAFPGRAIEVHTGEAYLVYKNGQLNPL